MPGTRRSIWMPLLIAFLAPIAMTAHAKPIKDGVPVEHPGGPVPEVPKGPPEQPNPNTNPDAAPTLESAKTGDDDGNGKIDRIVIRFSAPVAAAGDVKGRFTVADGGYVYAVSDATLDTPPVQLTLTLQERTSSDTGALPRVTYRRGAGGSLKNAKSDTEVAENESKDATDGAGPVIAAAVFTPTPGTASLGTIRVTFSEPVWDASVRTDPKSSFEATEASGKLDFGVGSKVATGAQANDEIVEIQMTGQGAAAPGAGDKLKILAGQGAAAAGIQDNSGNAASPKNPAIAIASGAPEPVPATPPTITSAVTADGVGGTANGRIDRIVVTFSEPVDAVNPQEAFTVTDRGFTYTITGATLSPSGESLTLDLQERNTGWDSAATPVITYQRGAGHSIMDKDPASPSEMENNHSKTAADKAGPAIVQAIYTPAAANEPGKGTIKVVFSEPVADPTGTTDASQLFVLELGGDFGSGSNVVSADPSRRNAPQGPGDLTGGAGQANDDTLYVLLQGAGAAAPAPDTSKIGIKTGAGLRDLAPPDGTGAPGNPPADDNLHVTIGRGPVPPRISSVETGDADANGHLDRLRIVFSERVKATTPEAAFSVTSPNYQVLSALSTPDNDGWITELTLVLQESPSGDTAALPTAAYQRAADLSHRIVDADGEEIPDGDSMKAVDKAPPAVIRAAYMPAAQGAAEGDKGTITVTFSEPIRDAGTPPDASTVFKMENGGSLGNGSTSATSEAPAPPAPGPAPDPGQVPVPGTEPPAQPQTEVNDNTLYIRLTGQDAAAPEPGKSTLQVNVAKAADSENPVVYDQAGLSPNGTGSGNMPARIEDARVAPVIKAVTTMDRNGNGIVDLLKVEFDAKVLDARFNKNAYLDSDFVLTGALVQGFQDGARADAENDEFLYLEVAEGPRPNGGFHGRFRAGPGFAHSHLEAESAQADIQVADGVKPVLLSAQGAFGSNRITVSFSEPVQTSSSGGSLTAEDFTLSDPSQPSRTLTVESFQSGQTGGTLLLSKPLSEDLNGPVRIGVAASQVYDLAAAANVADAGMADLQIESRSVDPVGAKSAGGGGSCFAAAGAPGSLGMFLPGLAGMAGLILLKRRRLRRRR